MFENLYVDKNKIYPTFVVSTMSSGKSTLINALLGKELLPSSNCACTAKSVAILDNDLQKEFLLHVVDKDGNYSLIKNADKHSIIKYNRSNELKELIVEGEISGIKNSKKSLFIIDTPGVNNSMDSSHELAAKSTLEEFSEGLIVYVINAQQLATYDDYYFLSMIANKIKSNDRFKIIFAVNKMDLIDREEEDPQQFINECYEYIQRNGIEKPIIIPISARNALLFKKILNGDKLSEMQEDSFTQSYKYFQRKGFSLKDYMIIPEIQNWSDFFQFEGKTYSRQEILAALENTGLPMLEKKMDEMLVDSLKMKSPEIKMRRNVKNHENNRKHSQTRRGRK